jgi:hypothetical protein
MDIKEITEIIEKYNLSIRYIPKESRETNELRHFKEGDEIVKMYGREFCTRVKKNENGGKYMVKEVNNNFSGVQWNTKKDNLADTLEDSIKLFLVLKEIEHKENLEKIKKFMIDNCQDCKDKKVIAVKRTYDYFGRNIATLREYFDIFENVFWGRDL